MSLPIILIENMIKTALQEDLGHGFDITTQSIIPHDANTRAILRVREEGVVAGVLVALTTFSHVDPELEFEMLAQDGDILEAGEHIAVIEGAAAGILTAERAALNFLIHMSGIATLTRRYVLAVQGTNAKICDTRKTLAGLRALQKYAVRAGGGYNHRHGLDDAVLIKDNHIAIAGGVAEALSRARDNTGHMVKIEIEVDTLAQLEDVLKHGGADVVMFDNFAVPDLARGVKMVGGKMVTEASGGVNLRTVEGIAETGVDYISIGGLTHSAPALDIGLDIE